MLRRKIHDAACLADPYHTYLSLAALSMYPPNLPETDANASSWEFAPLDPLLNAREETTAWIRKYIPGTSRQISSQEI